MTVAEQLPLASRTPVRAERFGVGLGFALLSSAAFATSGTLAAGLLQADWTPALAVTLLSARRAIRNAAAVHATSR